MLNRRAFMATTLGGLAAATLPNGAWAQTLADEQSVRFGLGFDDITSLDAHMAVLSSDIPIAGQIYEGLVTAPGGNLSTDEYQPGLATSWESSGDKKVWTFQLREGARWHGDYGELSSDDVKFSLERVAGKDFSSPFRGTMANVERVDIDGPRTIKITLKHPDSYFLQRVINYQAGYIVSRKALEAGVDIKTKPIGTGPFAIDSYQPRDKIVLVRHDGYWGKKQTLSELTYQFMSQLSTRELALRTGDIDGSDLDSRQDVIDRVRSHKSLVDITTSGTPYVLYINLTKKPFDNLKVRQALAHATDRDNLANFIGKELFAAEHSSVPAGYTGHIDDVQRYPHDVAKAKSLLAEAGFASGFSTDVIISNSTLYLPVMQVLQAQWKQAGININLKVVDHPTFHRLIRQDASPLIIYNADRYPKSAQVYYDQFYAGPAAIGKPTAITNFSHYGDAMPGIDDLLDKARYARSADEAKDLWAQAQKKVAQDLPSIPLYNQKNAIGRIKGLDIGYTLGNLPFYSFKDARLLES